MDWRWVAVATVAVLAGCGGFASEPTPTVTPAPVPELETTPTPEPGIAPGVTRRGVQDPDRLAEAHLEVIRGTSYVWYQRETTSSRVSNTTVNDSRSQVLRVEDERRYVYRTDSRELRQRANNQFQYNYTAYADGNRTHVRYFEPGKPTPTYERRGAANASSAYGKTATGYIRLFLDLPDATVVAIERDGQRYYRITGVRDSIPALGVVADTGVNATVSPDGFVRSVNVSYSTMTKDQTAFTTYSFEYTAVGNTTVERPSWMSGEETTPEERMKEWTEERDETGSVETTDVRD